MDFFVYRLKKCFFLLLFFLLLLSSAVGSERSAPEYSENTLIEMIGKPYSEYHDVYMQIMHTLLHDDSFSRIELTRLFDEAAKADKSGEWRLLCDMVQNTVLFYESRKGGFTWSSDYTAEDYSDKMAAIAKEAEKKGFRLIKTFALYQAAEGYHVFAQNYERAFACYLEAADELETISTKEFPPRLGIYNHIANLYLTFREYNEAITFYKKVADDPDAVDNYSGSYYPALNGLGLCYRNGYNNYDRSDECFRKLIQEIKPYELERMVWEGIAEGNIGCNFYLRGDYDTALTWLISSIDKITRHEDFAFVSNRAVNVADIYLKKNQPLEAKKYIDKALECHTLLGLPEKKSSLYEVLFKYHIYMGDRQLAELYHDSVVMAKNRESETYSGLVLRHIEQQLRASDKKVHEQELTNEKIKNNLLWRTIIIGAGALVIILFLLWIVFALYFRKRNAYRELVRKNQDWAGMSFGENSSEDAASEQCDSEGEEPAEEGAEIVSEVSDISVLDVEEGDRLVFSQVEKIILEKALFKDANLTLDSLAGETGFNKYYLSVILNRCTQKNFNTYINEFRVKEAIRMFSDPVHDNITIEGVAFESGFTDRKNFYRVFKKLTGLSPSEFRNNITA